MTIVEYKEEWADQFSRIKCVLENNLTRIVKIEHVGSTAIKGLCAKPLIDIDAVIEDKNDFEEVKKELELFGYSHRGDLGIIGREAFNRNGTINNEVLDSIDHNLYVCAQTSEELRRHLLFRDYCNKHIEAREEYRKIKMEIIEKYGNEDRAGYVQAKENEYRWFFEKIIKEAEFENEGRS